MKFEDIQTACTKLIDAGEYDRHVYTELEKAGILRYEEDFLLFLKEVGWRS